MKQATRKQITPEASRSLGSWLLGPESVLNLNAAQDLVTIEGALKIGEPLALRLKLERSGFVAYRWKKDLLRFSTGEVIARCWEYRPEIQAAKDAYQDEEMRAMGVTE